MNTVKVHRATPKLTACDKCGAPLPPEIVAELQKAPRFYACALCVSRGHLVIGLGGK